MGKIKWVVEFEIDESWVVDGFNLTNDKAHKMLSSVLQWADNTEFSAKVIKSPAKKLIKKLQS